MKFKSWYLYLHLLMFSCMIASCKSSHNEYFTENTIYVDIDKESQKRNLYYSSELFTNIELLTLEYTHESIISNISKGHVMNDLIYIQNDGLSLLVFDMKGKYINKIERRGRGNGEYTEIDDFIVLENGHILLLNDTKILEFDTNYQFIKQQIFPFYSEAFEVLDNEHLVLRGGINNEYISIWNIKHMQVINSSLDFDIKHTNRIMSPLWRYGKEVYFSRSYDNNIYRISNDSITIKWNINLGSRTLNDDYLIKGMYGAYAPDKSHYSIHNFFETSTYCIFLIQGEELGDYPYFAYYDKETNNIKTITYEYFKDDLMCISLPPNFIGKTMDGRLIAAIEPRRWKSDIQSNKNSDSKNWKNVNVLLEQIEDDSNPILLFYSIK